MSRDVTVLFGAPGTGKTTELIRVVKETLLNGTPPERIAYMSFSRKAALEARDRALEEFKLPAESFPWFRTLHSAAYRTLGLSRDEVMGTHHFRELGDAIGMVFQGSYDVHTDHIPVEHNGLGDRCLALYARAKARNWSLEEEWRYANEWDLPWAAVHGFSLHLDAYKRDRGVVDFTDMIDRAQSALDIDLLIIDEAQDLTPQQWAAARRFGAMARSIYLAGDDDQAIYSFSGATASPLLSVRGRRRVLPRSWRLPRAIKQLADRVAANIKTRAHKTFSSRDTDGLVTWVREPDDVDLSHGSWLLMCRNRTQMKKLETMARRQNVVYQLNGEWSNQEDPVRAVVMYERLRRGDLLTSTELKLISGYVPHIGFPEGTDISWNDVKWPFEGKPTWMDALELYSEDREYIRGLRRRGESLTKPGRVKISTVHGAKGGEAENVLLLTDVSGRVAKGMLSAPDEEWRVAYVGISRAIERLYLCQPSGRNFWRLAA